jgi:hypothetical protein
VTADGDVLPAGYFERVSETAEWLRGRGFAGSDVAIVLGSGLGAFADAMTEWPFPGVRIITRVTISAR